MIDYSIYYKQELSLENLGCESAKWAFFISAFNSAERVQTVFELVNAPVKKWIAFAEYKYRLDECPENTYLPEGRDEAQCVEDVFRSIQYDGAQLCVDITGFIRPYLLYLMRWLCIKGVRKFDALYSEPTHYLHREQTRFSDEEVRVVRPVYGYEGNHDPESSNDLLVIGAGYDHELISQVAESKESARKVQLFGFPPLRADMYQENVLRHRASESVGRDASEAFAPANDPFVTANVLHEVIDGLNRKQPITNLYLSPLATKPQVLGFGLYYLTECPATAASVIFPFCDQYSRETAAGLARLWKYTIELPAVR